jgi:hypothetical protein
MEEKELNPWETPSRFWEERENKNVEIVEVNELTVIFEVISPDAVFHYREDGQEKSITWEKLKSEYINAVYRVAPKLKYKGYRAVEIGTIAWFWLRRRRQGEFIQLNTMFLMRLLKRIPKI